MKKKLIALREKLESDFGNVRFVEDYWATTPIRDYIDNSVTEDEANCFMKFRERKNIHAEFWRLLYIDLLIISMK